MSLWPATIGATEPLDCDEAAYAYIGHRLLHGDVMYRDLTENKPPLGYWLYALAVAIGGYNELAIRLMPIPAVLLTIALVWWIGWRLGGPLAACLAAGLFVLLSTDPYLFGNGSNMEHFMNLFSVASLALLILAWNRHRRWPSSRPGFAWVRPRWSSRWPSCPPWFTSPPWPCGAGEIPRTTSGQLGESGSATSSSWGWG